MTIHRTQELIENGVNDTYVFLRSDLNVPLDDNLKITDDTRIKASLPTMNALTKAGAKVVVMAHLGRPKSDKDSKFSLKPVGERLGELADFKVDLADDIIGKDAQAKVSGMKPGEVVLLQNIRFDKAETSKDDSVRKKFAQNIMDLADGKTSAYIDDAFGAVHRKHASVYDLPQLTSSYAGNLIMTELDALATINDDPQTPYTVVLGGSKVSDKLGVIENLMKKADYILIGGGMVFTFLAALGYKTGKSIVEQDQVDNVKKYYSQAENTNCEFILPVDITVANQFSADADAQTIPADDIEGSAFGNEGMGLDTGPESGKMFAEHISRSKTVFWNGPMGVFEFRRFSLGTEAVAKSMAKATQEGAFTVVGGGDSVSAIHALGMNDEDFSHVSTGGGASLEYLEGKKLPGVEVLDR